MAFNLQKLENHSGSGAGPKLWSYNAGSDARAAVIASGYFNLAASLLSVGDMIYVKGANANFITAVVSNTAGVVATAAGAASGELEGTATWDPGSIADGDEEVKEVTVTGAALGDFALASLSIDVADLVLTACVTAANTVTASLANNTGGAIDLASATLRVRVLK
jgi:hypothetical protein